MILIPQRVLGEALQRSAAKFPSMTAIIAKGKEYSYGQFKNEAENLAKYLIHAGIRKGDKVAVYMDNSWQSVVSIYGATLAGAVFIVINPQTKADKLKYILNDSETKIIVSSQALRNELSKALEGADTIREAIISGDITSITRFSHFHIASFENCVQNDIVDIVFPVIIPNDLAALIYTSGSTGFPKGVMMTHQSMVFTTWSLIEYLRLSEDERIMLVLQLAFDYGLYQLLMSVTAGATLIVEQSFTFTATIYKNIEKYQPTIFPGVPTIYAMMIASHKETGISFECIKKITNTAALLSAETIPDLKKVFPNALIFKMYGLTECKRVCYLEPELIDLKPASVGKAIPGTEIFLLSPNGEPVKPGEPGILHIRGPHVMLGYLNKDDLTKEMFKDGKLPGERILCSNDWFKMDEDGFLYFLGRNDDIIKTRGEKVSPVEIENIIYKIAGVKEVAVMGVSDAIMGESIIAYITIHDTVQLTEKEVQRECMIYLEPFMIPQKVVFLSEMPKNSNGKIDKKELKNLKIDTIVKV
jgi:acyl-CoA synthetase (AMP-forming)/AMP-acid ligase II